MVQRIGGRPAGFLHIAVVLLLAAPSPAADIPEEHLPAHDGTLRLAVVGDAGLGTAAVARGIAAVQKEIALDAILLAGDNFYPHGVRSVDDPRWRILDPLVSLDLPIFAVLGNHDYSGRIEAQIAAGALIRQWHLPARNYVLRTPAADFALLDTTPLATGAERAEAGRDCPVCSTLEGAFSTSRTPWRIAMGHHTVVSSGWHGLFPRGEARRMRSLLPLLREARVDLYICGHDHHLELLRGTPPMLISGAGSDPVPPVRLHRQTLFPTGISLFEHVGFALLEVSPSTLRVRFYDSRGRALSEWIAVAKK